MRPVLLVADDSPNIQLFIELTFADENVEVISVANGDAAIARLETAPPNIVLADVDMPGKNGYEVARHMKATPALAHIPVVLLTAALDPSAQTLGCDGVLSKPFEPQLVITTVRDLLNRPAASAAAATPAPASHQSVARGTVPTLADAFAALLAAEEKGSDPAASPLWPAPPEPAPLVTEDLIEEIVRRVLARLPDHVVRDAVSDAVLTVAERLVQEEILKIKAAIK